MHDQLHVFGGTNQIGAARGAALDGDEIAKALGAQAHEHDPSRMKADALAATTIEEAVQIFNLISGNFVVTQVFFELARETPLAQGVPSLHGLNLGDMQRHVQLGDGRQLAECLNVITHALQKVRNDPTAVRAR